MKLVSYSRADEEIFVILTTEHYPFREAFQLVVKITWASNSSTKCFIILLETSLILKTNANHLEARDGYT